MEEETPRAKTPSRSVTRLIKDVAKQWSSRSSAASVSSIESFQHSFDSEISVSEHASGTATTEPSAEVPGLRSLVASQTASEEGTLVEESQIDWGIGTVRDGQHVPRAGERMRLNLPRGIISRSGLTTDDEVIRKVEQSIAYHFRNPELLLEALESPGSGMVCVGKGNRPVPHGNKALAKFGQAVMEMALHHQFYILSIPTAEHPRMLNLVGRENLATVGMAIKIDRWIRPKQGLPPSHQRNWLRVIKDDARAVTGEKDPKRMIARAMRALVGGAQLDGGQVAAEKVMTELKLLIRDPRT